MGQKEPRIRAYWFRLSPAARKQICLYAESNPCKTAEKIAKELSLGRRTIYCILQRRDEFISWEPPSEEEPYTDHNNHNTYCAKDISTLECSVLQWVTDQRLQRRAFTDDMLQEEATRAAREDPRLWSMGFEATPIWVLNFKARNSIPLWASEDGELPGPDDDANSTFRSMQSSWRLNYPHVNSAHTEPETLTLPRIGPPNSPARFAMYEVEIALRSVNSFLRLNSHLVSRKKRAILERLEASVCRADVDEDYPVPRLSVDGKSEWQLPRMKVSDDDLHTTGGVKDVPEHVAVRSAMGFVLDFVELQRDGFVSDVERKGLCDCYRKLMSYRPQQE